MKKMIQKSFLSLLAITLFLIQPLTIYAESEENAAFDDFMMSEFVDMNESDYVTMHFTVMDPSKYGIEETDPNIGKIYTKEETIAENQKSLDKLHEFDYNSLSKKQQVDYDEYEYELEAAIAQLQYDDYEMLYTPGSNVAENIVTNLSEFVFRDEQDIKDYLEVLRSIPDFISDTLDVTKEQAANGIYLTDAMLEETLSWFDDFLAKQDDNALLDVFDSQIDEISFVEEAQKEQYKQENKQLVLEQILPSYQTARDVLESLKGSRQYGDSLYDLPNGADYYDTKLETTAATDMSVQELLDLCTTTLQDTVSQYMLLSMSSSDDEGASSIQLSTPEDILFYLKSQLSNEFPMLDSFSYKAEYLDESVANDLTVAYYMQCPIDDVSANSIKINGDNVSDANELYTTLAHEGITGHMYQRNYYISTNPNPLRLMMGTLGYGEGWAMYAEIQMWNYAGISKNAQKDQALNLELNYVLNAAIDLGVNGLGWDESEVASYLEKLGLNTAIAKNLRDYVVLYPMALVPYGCGLAQFLKIRNDAENALKEKFDALEFNKVLLDNGDRNFNLISQDVEEWVSEQGSTIITPVMVESVNWFVIGGIACVLVVVGVVAFVIGKKHRKDDSFVA